MVESVINEVEMIANQVRQIENMIQNTRNYGRGIWDTEALPRLVTPGPGDRPGTGDRLLDGEHRRLFRQRTPVTVP